MKKRKYDAEIETAINPEDIEVEVPAPGKDEAEVQDQIFHRGVDGVYWREERLHEFSYERRRAAFAMGLKLVTLSEGELRKLAEPATPDEDPAFYYNGIDTDALLIFWLRKSSKSDVMKAIRLPQWGEAQMMKLGEAENIVPGPPEFAA